MKRVFLVAALFFSAAVVRAEYIPSLQSTATCGAVNFVLVATGSIKVEQIVVASPTVNQSASMIGIFPSTTSGIGGYNPNVTTGTFLSTNIVATGPGVTPFSIDYNFNLSSGMVINKQGAACTEVFWRFVYPENEFIGLTGRTPPLDDYRP